MNPKDLVGAKKAPLRYVPPAGAIESSGPHEDGAIKYGPFNWRETPVEMVTYLEAIDRHLAALKDGQDFAEDSGYSHIGHIIAGANIIADAKAHGTLIDNRFAAGPAADMLRARDKSAPTPQQRIDVANAGLIPVEDMLARVRGEQQAVVPAGFTRCPTCGDLERVEDIVSGVCLACADAIAFGQNMRRGAINVEDQLQQKWRDLGLKARVPATLIHSAPSYRPAQCICPPGRLQGDHQLQCPLYDLPDPV